MCQVTRSPMWDSKMPRSGMNSACLERRIARVSPGHVLRNAMLYCRVATPGFGKHRMNEIDGADKVNKSQTAELSARDIDLSWSVGQATEGTQ